MISPRKTLALWAIRLSPDEIEKANEFFVNQHEVREEEDDEGAELLVVVLVALEDLLPDVCETVIETEFLP